MHKDRFRSDGKLVLKITGELLECKGEHAINCGQMAKKNPKPKQIKKQKNKTTLWTEASAHKIQIKSQTALEVY